MIPFLAPQAILVAVGKWKTVPGLQLPTAGPMGFPLFHRQQFFFVLFFKTKESIWLAASVACSRVSESLCS